jgi:hypothetical protein
MHIKL